MEVSETDFGFLRGLSSLYEALSISATDSIVIMNIVEIGKSRIPMGMFCDVFGDGGFDDVSTAEEIMKKRIETASNDIKEHNKYHSEFLQLFYSIDKQINADNRGNVAKVSQTLCKKVGDSVSSLVEPHITRLEEDSFLYYPSCHRDHSFIILPLISSLEFNQESTYSGAEDYLEEIVELSNDFRLSKEKIPIDKIATQEDIGKGIMDTSLRGRHELNKELLYRIGLVV